MLGTSGAKAGDAETCRDGTGAVQIAACTQAIAVGGLEGHDLAAYASRGSAYRDANDFARAIADLDEAIRLDPSFADAYRNRGIAYRLQYDLDLRHGDRARSAFRALVQRARRDVRDQGGDRARARRLQRSDQARPQTRQGLCEPLRDLCRRARPRTRSRTATRDPLALKFENAYKERGRAYAYAADYGHAIADFSEAIRLDPKTAKGYVNRAIAYTQAKDDEHALADLDEAIRIDPQNANAYVSRGLSYARRHDFPRAIGDLNTAIRIDPHAANAFNARGSIYIAERDIDRAIADVSEAIRLDPKLAEALARRCGLYLDKHDFARVIADCDAAIRLDPKIVRAYEYRGAAYGRSSDYDHAIADFDEAIRLDPRSAFAYMSRGFAYTQKGPTARHRRPQRGDRAQSEQWSPMWFVAVLMPFRTIRAIADSSTRRSGRIRNSRTPTSRAA